jgi:glutamate-1-semialdehyde 2,1-aminomutase
MTHDQELALYKKRTPKSHELHQQALRVQPKGVSSNFRAYKPYPIFVDRAAGSRLWDADGNEYVDFSMCFGALMVGHAHPVVVKAISDAAHEGTLYGMPHVRELRTAEAICKRFDLEQIRFTNSGSESTMHALRLARAFTGRDKVLKFEGAYHGGHDTVLISVKPKAAEAGPPHRPTRVPVGKGIPLLTQEDTLVATWNDPEGVRALLGTWKADLAAIIVEPVMMNAGVIPPSDGFLQELRALCDEIGALLVFDEVKTGAKLAWGGAQQHFGVKADIVCLAKAMAGGLPLGAFGARRELMDKIASGDSFHAGTYTSNPLAVAGCLAALEEVLVPDVYAKASALGDALAAGHNAIIKKRGLNACAVNVGVNGTVFWRKTPPTNHREWLEQDEKAFWHYYHASMNRGVLPQPSGNDEQWTVSVAHTQADVDRMLAVFDEVAAAMA